MEEDIASVKGSKWFGNKEELLEATVIEFEELVDRIALS